MKKLITEIANEIKTNGGTAYYVGGYVRDKLINIPNKDIDIEVHRIEPIILYEILKRYGSVKKVGQSFGIFLFEKEIDGVKYKIDFSLPRKERKIGERHVDFEITCDPFLGEKEASRRRDITINALMMDVLTEDIKDYHGGLCDLMQGLIKCVNNDTFIEDPLRVYRVARFAAQLNFRVDTQLIELCKTIDTSALTHERVYSETNKALLGNNPRKYFEVLKQMNRLKDFFPELSMEIGIKQNKKYHHEDVFEHTMMCLDAAKFVKGYTSNSLYFMWAALLHDVGKPYIMDPLKTHDHSTIGAEYAHMMIQRFTKDKLLDNYLKIMVSNHMKPLMLFNDKSKKCTRIKFMDQPFSNDLLWLGYSDLKGRVTDNSYRMQLEIYNYLYWAKDTRKLYDVFLNTTDFITGQDFIDLGVAQGPDIGKCLKLAKKMEYKGCGKEKIIHQCITMLKKQVL